MQQANRPAFLPCSEQVYRRYYYEVNKYAGVLPIQRANRSALLPCSELIVRRYYHAVTLKFASSKIFSDSGLPWHDFSINAILTQLSIVRGDEQLYNITYKLNTNSNLKLHMPFSVEEEYSPVIMSLSQDNRCVSDSKLTP